MVKIAKKGLLLVLIVLAFVIGTQNPIEVQVNYILASSTLPLATILAITFIIGLLIGCLIGTASVSKLKWQNYRLNRKDKVNADQINTQ